MERYARVARLEFGPEEKQKKEDRMEKGIHGLQERNNIYIYIYICQ